MAKNGNIHATLQASQKTLEEIYSISPLVGRDSEADRAEFAEELKGLGYIVDGDIDYMSLKRTPAASAAGDFGPAYMDRILTNLLLEGSLTIESANKVLWYFVSALGYQEDILVEKAELDSWKYLATIEDKNILLFAKMLAKTVNVFSLDAAGYIYLLKRVLLEETFHQAFYLIGEWIPLYVDPKYNWIYKNLFRAIAEKIGIEDLQTVKGVILARADKKEREGKDIEPGVARIVEWLRNHGDEVIAECTSVVDKDAPTVEEEVEEVQPQPEPELIVQPAVKPAGKQSTAERLAAIRESVVVEGEDDDNSYVAPSIQIQPATSARTFEVPSVNITINEPKSSSGSSGGSGGGSKSSDGWETAGEIIGGVLIVGALGFLGYWAYNKFFGDSSSDIELLDFSNGVDIL